MADIQKIRSREEIPTQDKWAIEDLYPTDAAWEQALSELEAKGKELAAFSGRLAESGQVLYNYLRQMEQTNVLAERLANYCMRKADEDTRNATYQSMKGKFMGAYVAISASTSFETPEIMAISEDMLDSFYRECPDLARYRRFLSSAASKALGYFLASA